MALRTTLVIGNRLRRAFTLVEVLIVIAILGAVTAIAITDFGSMMDNASKPSAYETLRDAVEAGREGARNVGGPVKLIFDANAGALRLITAGATEDFPLPGVNAVAFTLPAEDADGAARPLDSLIFHPSGCATPALIDLSMGLTHSRYRMEMFSTALTPEVAR